MTICHSIYSCTSTFLLLQTGYEEFSREDFRQCHLQFPPGCVSVNNSVSDSLHHLLPEVWGYYHASPASHSRGLRGGPATGGAVPHGLCQVKAHLQGSSPAFSLWLPLLAPQFKTEQSAAQLTSGLKQAVSASSFQVKGPLSFLPSALLHRFLPGRPWPWAQVGTLFTRDSVSSAALMPPASPVFSKSEI